GLRAGFARDRPVGTEDPWPPPRGEGGPASPARLAYVVVAPSSAWPWASGRSSGCAASMWAGVASGSTRLAGDTGDAGDLRTPAPGRRKFPGTAGTAGGI